MSDMDEENKDTSRVIDDIMWKESEIDYASGFRAFANKNNVRVLRNLSAGGPKSLKDLMNETGLAKGELNHRLQFLKNLDIVILQEHKYFLTKYGLILVDALLEIQRKLLKESDPFSAANRNLIQQKNDKIIENNKEIIVQALSLARSQKDLEERLNPNDPEDLATLREDRDILEEKWRSLMNKVVQTT